MRMLAALASALLWAAPGLALELPDLGRPVAQIALQPVPDPLPADIEAAMSRTWAAYFRQPGENGFGADQLRAGRIDLDGDGISELLILVEAPSWRSHDGFPLMIARWGKTGWSVIGWGYAQSDGVFAMSDRAAGWATIETPSHWLRWNGAGYQAQERPLDDRPSPKG